MRSVLVRSPRGDELDSDLQLDPPSAQPGQTECTRSAERPPIIRADHPRQPILAENFFEDPLGLGQIGLHHQLEAHNVASRLVANRQWIHSGPVSCAIPTLEVDRPDLIGPASHSQFWSWHNRTFGPESPRLFAQPPPFEPSTDGCFRRQIFATKSALQKPPELRSAPRRIKRTPASDPPQPQSRRTIVHTGRHVRSIPQGAASTLFKTPDPFVRCFSTHFPPPTLRGQPTFLAQPFTYKSPTLIF